MNIQIFGTNKSFDTKKAQRWFKERRIKFQMVDLKEKGLSRGEFDRVCQAVGGWQALVDETAKDQDTLALLRWLDESQQADKLAVINVDVSKVAGGRSLLSVFQFVEDPTGCGVFCHHNGICKGITLGNATGKVWDGHYIAGAVVKRLEHGGIS